MPGGRPHTLDEKKADALVKATRDGLPQRLAADAVGITPRAFSKWLARGRKAKPGDEAFVRLVQRIKVAVAENVARRVKRIEKAGVKGNWTADAWYLERVHPGLFGSNRTELAQLRKELKELAARVPPPHDQRQQPPADPAKDQPPPGPAADGH